MTNYQAHDYPRLATELFAKDYEPIPIAPGQKFPTLKNWQNIKLPIRMWPQWHGIGLRTGGNLVGIDIDVYFPEMVKKLLVLLRKLCGEFTYRVGMPPKVLTPVCCPEITSKITSNKWIDQHGVINQIEVLSKGQQFVAHGVHPDTQEPYRWYGGSLLSQPPPSISKDQVFEFFNLLSSLAMTVLVLENGESPENLRKLADLVEKKEGNYHRRYDHATVIAHRMILLNQLKLQELEKQRREIDEFLADHNKRLDEIFNFADHCSVLSN